VRSEVLQKKATWFMESSISKASPSSKLHSLGLEYRRISYDLTL